MDLFGLWAFVSRWNATRIFLEDWVWVDRVFYSDRAASQLTAIVCQEESFLEQHPTVCKYTESSSFCCSSLMLGWVIQPRVTPSLFQCLLCPPSPGQQNPGGAANCSSLGIMAPLGLQPGAKYVAPSTDNDLSCCWCSLLFADISKARIRGSLFISISFLHHTSILFFPFPNFFECLCF